MAEDFALIDFALSARPPAEIAEALGRFRSGGGPSEGAAAPRGGFLSRLLKRGGEDGHAAQGRRRALLIQPDGSLGAVPLSRPVLTDMGFGAGVSPVRLSAPIGVGGLTLIEFREADGELSSLCHALSADLRGDEVFYFRYSGSRHPGAHFAFHVYQDGRVTRRAASISAQGAVPEADWQGLDTGMPHPLETDSMPPPGTPSSKIMTPMRQAMILEALGVDPEALFVDTPADLVTLELSDAEGGLPLSSVHAVLAQKLGQMAAEAPGDTGAEDTGHPDVPPAQDPHASADTAARPDPSWEEEVTRLLVEAVDSALPPEDQVAWLDALTARLEAGEVDAALDQAQHMIDAGNWPPATKRAAIGRLAELFGRTG